MASYSLYPPIVNSTEPAFLVYDSTVSPENNRGTLRINFYLSAFSADIPVSNLSVHVKIFSSKNIKVLNPQDGSQTETVQQSSRLRGAGMILNLALLRDETDPEGMYYINIRAEDIKWNWKNTQYRNWTPGWIYKVQIRLSDIVCPSSFNNQGQEAWLFSNQDHFSEWSTVIYAKAISPMRVTLNSFENGHGTLPSPIPFTNNFPKTLFGKIQPGVTYDNSPPEYYKSYRFRIEWITTEEVGGTVINQIIDFEDSGDLFAENQNQIDITYTLKRKLRTASTEYRIILTYVTLNDAEGVEEYYFTYAENSIPQSDLRVITAEDLIPPNTNTIPSASINFTYSGGSHIHNTDSSFSIGKDEEEGRISLRLAATNYDYSAKSGVTNFCIRRASAEDGFIEWTPIYYGVIPPISDIRTCDEFKEIKFDYTVQSGIWYKYGLEIIDENDNIISQNYPSIDDGYVLRIFEHGYLLGEGGQQLKVAFDPIINSYANQVADTKVETIGGKFPYVSRNTAMWYRMFSISGTIASQMDEEGLFFNREKYYNRINYDDNNFPIIDINSKYQEYAQQHQLSNRDFTLERDFRNEVLKFLGDGKPKLYKSPSEGNIIVRLTDISAMPNQNLNKLIYSFSANANEIDDYTMDNCLKYGFYNPKTYQNITIIEDN